MTTREELEQTIDNLREENDTIREQRDEEFQRATAAIQILALHYRDNHETHFTIHHDDIAILGPGHQHMMKQIMQLTKDQQRLRGLERHAQNTDTPST